jgi:hypothetical protein
MMGGMCRGCLWPTAGVLGLLAWVSLGAAAVAKMLGFMLTGFVCWRTRSSAFGCGGAWV